MNEIYVIGHHNPDTDSIVSAMAYAALRNALGDRNYVAAHMDHISDQTQRMLDRFGFQPPRTVQNVRTQVEDLDYDTPPALNATVTMDRAWHIMREQKISAIPVINEDGTLYGTLSAGDIRHLQHDHHRQPPGGGGAPVQPAQRHRGPPAQRQRRPDRHRVRQRGHRPASELREPAV